jgi:hypothetical protein
MPDPLRPGWNEKRNTEITEGAAHLHKRRRRPPTQPHDLTPSRFGPRCFRTRCAGDLLRLLGFSAFRITNAFALEDGFSGMARSALRGFVVIFFHRSSEFEHPGLYFSP